MRISKDETQEMADAAILSASKLQDELAVVREAAQPFIGPIHKIPDLHERQDALRTALQGQRRTDKPEYTAEEQRRIDLGLEPNDICD